MVHRRDPRGPARGLRSRARDDGDPALRLCDLGVDPELAGRDVQGDGASERLLPHVHPDELPREGEGARRGLLPGARRRHDRRRQGVGGAPRRPAHERDHHQPHVLAVGAVLPRPAAADQPVGQRGALGAADEALPAHPRVPLAGGPHGPRHGRGGGGGDPPHARGLPPLRARHGRGARGARPQDGAGRSSPAPSAPTRSRHCSRTARPCRAGRATTWARTSRRPSARSTWTGRTSCSTSGRPAGDSPRASSAR